MKYRLKIEILAVVILVALATVASVAQARSLLQGIGSIAFLPAVYQQMGSTATPTMTPMPTSAPRLVWNCSVAPDNVSPGITKNITIYGGGTYGDVPLTNISFTANWQPHGSKVNMTCSASSPGTQASCTGKPGDLSNASGGVNIVLYPIQGTDNNGQVHVGTGCTTSFSIN